MTTLPQQFTIDQYISDGVTLVYPYTFLILEPTDLIVYNFPAGTVPPAAIKTYNVDYTVQGAGQENGGTVTFAIAPPISSIITIVRAIQASITTNYADARQISGINLDDSFQRCMLVSQQLLSDFLQYSLTYSPGTTIPNSVSNIVPPLPNNNVWVGLNGAIIAVALTESVDFTTLRAMLASNVQGADGASIVGYYDVVNGVPTTVDAELQFLSTQQNLTKTLADTGSANAIICTSSPTFNTLSEGLTIKVMVSSMNQGSAPTTLNLNGTGDVPVKVSAALGNLPDTTLLGGHVHFFTYSGGTWYVNNPSMYHYAAAVKFSGAAQVFTAGENAVFAFDTAISDPNNFYTIATGTFKPTIQGVYQVNTVMQISSVTNACPVAITIVKNGTPFKQIGQDITLGGGKVGGISGLGSVYCNGTTDSFQIFVTNAGSESVTFGVIALDIPYCEVLYVGISTNT